MLPVIVTEGSERLKETDNGLDTKPFDQVLQKWMEFFIHIHQSGIQSKVMLGSIMVTQHMTTSSKNHQNRHL